MLQLLQKRKGGKPIALHHIMMMKENKNANLLCLLGRLYGLDDRVLNKQKCSISLEPITMSSQTPPLNLFKNIYLIAFVPVKVEKLTSFCECQLKILGFYDAHLLFQLAKTY